MELIRPDINLDFVGKRKLFLLVSLSLVILSVLVLFSKGMNYGIDFTGGTLVQVQLTRLFRKKHASFQNAIGIKS